MQSLGTFTVKVFEAVEHGPFIPEAYEVNELPDTQTIDKNKKCWEQASVSTVTAGKEKAITWNAMKYKKVSAVPLKECTIPYHSQAIIKLLKWQNSSKINETVVTNDEIEIIDNDDETQSVTKKRKRQSSSSRMEVIDLT